MSSSRMEETLDASQPDKRDVSAPLNKNTHLLNWVEKMAALTKPANVHWVDGSAEEDEAFKAQMVASGTFVKLNDELWPGCQC